MLPAVLQIYFFRCALADARHSFHEFSSEDMVLYETGLDTETPGVSRGD